MNPYAILALIALLGAAAGSGAYAEKRYRDGLDAEQKLAQIQANEEAQRLINRNSARINDGFVSDRLRSERAAADLADRLRQRASAISEPPGCPHRNDDPRPAIGLLHDETRDDLVALVREAEAVSDRLRACQGRESLGTP